MTQAHCACARDGTDLHPLSRALRKRPPSLSTGTSRSSMDLTASYRRSRLRCGLCYLYLHYPRLSRAQTRLPSAENASASEGASLSDEGSRMADVKNGTEDGQLSWRMEMHGLVRYAGKAGINGLPLRRPCDCARKARRGAPAPVVYGFGSCAHCAKCTMSEPTPIALGSRGRHSA